jgi:DNA-binding NarL/FixJ family response regulator
MSKDIRILLVEDHDIVREGLRSLLEARPHHTVVAEAATGREALELARTASPQVAIVDINLPEMNGIETTRLLRKSFPELKVIGLSVHTGGRLVGEMISAGAAAYLPKSSAARELFAAIESVLKGRMYISPTVNHAGSGPAHDLLASLSPRERQVLQLFAEGRTTKEVAAHLHLAEVTAHTHRQNIMRKLRCRSIAEITRLAIREGVTSLDFS